MDVPNYKPNSHKYKAEQAEKAKREKIDKVITGTAKVKPKTTSRKLADMFISEDATNVKSYIFADVLVPALKKLITDIVKDSVDMIFNGSVRRSDRSSGYRVNHVNYSDYSRRDDYRRVDTYRSRGKVTYRDIVLDSRADVEAVFNKMQAVINQYGHVTVGALHEMLEITGDYTDESYGWVDIHKAYAIRTEDGYALGLPKALPID